MSELTKELDTSVSKAKNGDQKYLRDGEHGTSGKVVGHPADKSHVSTINMILVSGLALFSDGYNAQIIGYMNPLFEDLYPDTFSPTVKTRLSNAYLIGEIFGMLFYGYVTDIFGRRTGIFLATLFLVIGIAIATASSGKSHSAMFWMMTVGRGVAGFGAGGMGPQSSLPIAWAPNC